MDLLGTVVAYHDGPSTLYVPSRHPSMEQTVAEYTLRADFLIPLSPTLPLLSPLFISFLRSITTAEYLHQPYFETKGMNQDEVWRWVEERKWAYRGESEPSCLKGSSVARGLTLTPLVAFGFAASLLESIPIAGLFFSIPNRIGAAMM